jgi:hypothetical protein
MNFVMFQKIFNHFTKKIRLKRINKIKMPRERKHHPHRKMLKKAKRMI